MQRMVKNTASRNIWLAMQTMFWAVWTDHRHQTHVDVASNQTALKTDYHEISVLFTYLVSNKCDIQCTTYNVHVQNAC